MKAIFEASPREDALRVMEAARVYRVLDRPWVIVTGGIGSGPHTDAERMAQELETGAERDASPHARKRIQARRLSPFLNHARIRPALRLPKPPIRVESHRVVGHLSQLSMDFIGRKSHAHNNLRQSALRTVKTDRFVSPTLFTHTE